MAQVFEGKGAQLPAFPRQGAPFAWPLDHVGELFPKVNRPPSGLHEPRRRAVQGRAKAVKRAERLAGKPQCSTLI